MAVVPRIATLRIDDTATHEIHRTWVATAAVQDTPEGQSVDITTEMTTAGATPPALPTTLTLSLYNDAGALVRAFTLDPAAASQVSTFFLTSNGTAAGAPSADTLEIAIRATRTEAVTYDVETDGSPNSPPTGNHAHTLDRGWIRGTTTANLALSNVALGGAKSTPGAYDDSLYVRTTLGATLYVPRALTVNLSGASPPLSGATNSAASGNWDVTFANVVDTRFPAAPTTVSTSLGPVPNATLTGQPATVLTPTNDTLQVDARNTVSQHHFQLSTGFLRSKHDPAKAMLSTQTAFLASRIVNARGEGVNGLTVEQSLVPVEAGETTGPTASATATRDGEAGWTDLLVWGASKPGGFWTKAVNVTAPADASDDAYLLNSTDTVTLLAFGPYLVRGHLNKMTGQRGHFTAGDALVANATVVDLLSGVRLDPARITEPTVGFLRYGASDHTLEMLDGTLTWVTWTPAAPYHAHAMTSSPNDPRNYIFEIADTSTWVRDVTAVMFVAKIDGTPHPGFASREETGRSNSHEGYQVDPLALALHGIIGNR